jgi:hypothetical protein
MPQSGTRSRILKLTNVTLTFFPKSLTRLCATLFIQRFISLIMSGLIHTLKFLVLHRHSAGGGSRTRYHRFPKPGCKPLHFTHKPVTQGGTLEAYGSYALLFDTEKRHMIGMVRFELTTTRLPDECANQTAPHPVVPRPALRLTRA